MPRKLTRPKQGDKQLSAKDLTALYDEVDRLGKFNATSAGMSNGGGGIAIAPIVDDVEGCKLVLAPWLPGAFGGPSNGYANIETYRTKYEEYGNYAGNNSPAPTRKNRKVYPRDCTVWKVKSDQLEETGEIIKVVNLGSYAHPVGWYLVSPVGDDLYTVINELGGQRAITAVWTDDGDSASGSYRGIRTLEAKFIRGSISADQQTPSTVDQFNWAHVDAATGDLFIHAPGVYELTYGVEAYVNIWNADNINAQPGSLWTSPFGSMATTGGASAGTPHTHSAGDGVSNIIPAPLPFSVHLVQNFNGQSTPIDWANHPGGYWNNELPLVIPAGTVALNSLSGVMGEKTVIRTQALEHGQGTGSVFNRFNLLVSTYSFGTVPFGKFCSVGIRRAWITARIVDENYYSPGYNAFCGAKTTDNPTGFQWWGGGPRPARYGRDGVIIPW